MIPNDYRLWDKLFIPITSITTFILFFSLTTLPLTAQVISPIDSCEADFGIWIPLEDDCLSDGTKRLAAEPLIPPVVPEGFMTTFLLTSGDEATIRGFSNQPFFIVEGEGELNIHALVHDTATLSLDTFYLGRNRLEQINQILLQGGGDICGALDTNGIVFEFGGCGCEADAGTLSANSACYDGSNSVLLEASFVDTMNVPEDFEVVYLLSTAPDGVIQSISESPSFFVNGTGEFTIHTLVYHPATFFLRFIQEGRTRVDFISSFLLPFGGFICADLDLKGAVFAIDNCPTNELATPLVFPNPVDNVLNIQIPNTVSTPSELTVELLDALGRITKTQVLDPEVKRLTFNVSNLPEGLYAIRLRDEEKIFFGQQQLIVVKH